MPDKSKERQEADAAFERATSQSRQASPEGEPVPDKTSKLKDLRLEREAADALKRKQSER